MGDNTWWIDPPRNFDAGGLLIQTHEKYSYVNITYNESYFYTVGWKCEKQAIFLGSDKYEAYSYHGFVKFDIPIVSEAVLENVYLHLYAWKGKYLDDSRPSYMDINAYTRTGKTLYPAPKGYLFPWDTMDEWDMEEDNWEFVDSWNMADVIDDVLFGPDWHSYWLTKIDVTSGYQLAIDNGWGWFAVRLSPGSGGNHQNYPVGWDYDSRPTAYNQECWANILGATTPFWEEAPTGFPNAECHPSPWLEIVFSGGASQSYPGELEYTEEQPEQSQAATQITALASDPKAQSALAGTDVGSLWYCWSGGGFWNKIFEIGEEITSIYMDYQRNFQDFPDTQITWFGTISGSLYKSTTSLFGWVLSKSFDGKIVSIRGSELNSNKVVVGVGYEIWTTVDGGDNWGLSKG